MFLFIVVFIIPIDLKQIHPAAMINDPSGERPDVYPTDGAPNGHPPMEESSSGEEVDDIASDSGKLPKEESCLNCEHQRSVEQVRNELGENELVKQRLEFIKEQILEKLRMTKRPTAHFHRTKLPAPLLYAHGEIMQNDYPQPSASSEEYSGRFAGEQNQIIIFGKQGEFRHTPFCDFT